MACFFLRIGRGSACGAFRWCAAARLQSEEPPLPAFGLGGVDSARHEYSFFLSGFDFFNLPVCSSKNKRTVINTLNV